MSIPNPAKTDSMAQLPSGKTYQGPADGYDLAYAQDYYQSTASPGLDRARSDFVYSVTFGAATLAGKNQDEARKIADFASGVTTVVFAVTMVKASGTRNISVPHGSRKEAKEAAAHAHGGKPKPTPKKDAPSAKRKAYEEQQKYKKPESHPDSAHPESHFHDSNKSSNSTNVHHTYPTR